MLENHIKSLKTNEYNKSDSKRKSINIEETIKLSM